MEGIQKKMAKVIRTNKKKKTESVCETFYLFWGYLLDLLICIYMLLILVVLPFYNEEGFTHIGTDKAMFFRNAALRCGMVLMPVLVLFLAFKLVLFFMQQGEEPGIARGGKGKRKDGVKALWLAVKTYCKNEMSATDRFALAYGVAVILSYVFSAYQEEALWGTTGWYMGAMTQLLLVFSYFLISRAWTARNWMLLSVLPVSAVVFVLGLFNRFGYFPIDMQVENVLFISTIGNVNWYCGYLVSVFFGVVFLLWKKDWKRLWQKALLMGYVLIGFATLVTHGSTSGVVTMAIMIFVFFCLSVPDGKRMEAFWLELCLLSLASTVIFLLRHYKILTIVFEDEGVMLFTGTILPIIMTVVSFIGYLGVHYSNQKLCYPQKLFGILVKLACGGIVVVVAAYVLVLFINTQNNGALLASTILAESNMFTFSPTWGSNRGATWLAGLLCFWEQDFLHKLVGVGPDCMAAFIYGDAGEDLLAMVKETFASARLTNAHNEWLTMLVQVGIFGAVSYVGMMISAIKRYIGSRDFNIVTGICGCCLLAYTINNMFSFQQSMSAATIFIILGVGENYIRNNDM